MIRHIVWYLDLSQAELEMLERVAEFAARHGARLRAVFIEDESLLRSAELPCTREVSLTTGRVRSLEPERLRLQLRRRHEHIRQRLEQLGRHSALEWSLDMVSGRRDRLQAASLPEPGEVQVVVLDPGDELAEVPASGGSRLVLSRRFRPAELVLAVFEDAGRDLPVVLRARWLARQGRLPLWLAVPAEQAAGLEPVLASLGLADAMLPLGGWTLAALLAVATDRASLLVLHQDSTLLAGARMRGINAALLVAPEREDDIGPERP